MKLLRSILHELVSLFFDDRVLAGGIFLSVAAARGVRQMNVSPYIAGVIMSVGVGLAIALSASMKARRAYDSRSEKDTS